MYVRAEQYYEEITGRFTVEHILRHRSKVSSSILVNTHLFSAIA